MEFSKELDVNRSSGVSYKQGGRRFGNCHEPIFEYAGIPEIPSSSMSLKRKNRNLRTRRTHSEKLKFVVEALVAGFFAYLLFECMDRAGGFY